MPRPPAGTTQRAQAGGWSVVVFVDGNARRNITAKHGPATLACDTDTGEPVDKKEFDVRLTASAIEEQDQADALPVAELAKSPRARKALT